MSGVHRHAARVFVALSLAALLAACLPDPRPGHKARVGEVETLTSGSAFGIASGMPLDEAHSTLRAGGAFTLKFIACMKPGFDDRLDLPYHKGCPKADDLQEVWRADSLLPGEGWETLLLNVRDGRIGRIRWNRAVGYPG
jgi:hypothetical protein